MQASYTVVNKSRTSTAKMCFITWVGIWTHYATKCSDKFLDYPILSNANHLSCEELESRQLAMYTLKHITGDEFWTQFLCWQVLPERKNRQKPGGKNGKNWQKPLKIKIYGWQILYVKSTWNLYMINRIWKRFNI